ncbi:MAG: DMT family transporter [Defluviicoccus sp.]|nr:DMT family transporter [Defluviicoccus sp.]MDG4591553.1 DMT family transporter [Defluviicoccus sp.]
MPGLWPGGSLALASAALFGASTPFAKALLGTTDPWMLAGLLYLGSGIGLLAVRLARRLATTGRGEATLRGKDWPWFGAAVLAGGVMGPLLLMIGLALTPASTTSLLLTLEGVFTALVAWVVFREHFHWRIGIGMAAISAGAMSLAWTDSMSLEGLAGPLLIASACLAWAIDNNLTRKVSLSDPVQIAMLKGLVAGSTNLLLALATGGVLPDPVSLSLAWVVGFAGYGVSLVLFVTALRHIGTARTGAYFSTAPFVGAAIAIVVLGEAATSQILVAGVLMGVGVWLHLTESHAHQHEHEGIVHAHRHRHDDHHRHEHGPGAPPGEPHTHRHVHASLKHAHSHYPDAHHAHAH